MQYRIAAYAQALAGAALERLADRRGQGTVEYVGVVVMVTLLVAAVGLAAKSWGEPVGKELRSALTDSIDRATSGLKSSR